MKALGWDDEPQSYLEPLKHHLAVDGITLEITSAPSEFLRRFRSDRWDFIVTDLFSDNTAGTPMESSQVGFRVAGLALQAGLPVFVITQHIDKTEVLRGLPDGVIVRSKSSLVEWTAHDIHQELLHRGLIFDRHKVFLIYGGGEEAIHAKERLVVFLEELGLEVESFSGVNLKTDFAEGLITRMHRCGAFLALCTADDEWRDGTRHPRQNVILEIGVALGLPRGLERLTILQRTGPEQKMDLRAQLPSDLHGIMTMRFYDEIEAIFEDLKRRFAELGVEIK